MLAGLFAASLLLGPAAAAAPAQSPPNETANDPPAVAAPAAPEASNEAPALDIQPTVVTKPKDEETLAAVPEPEDVPEAKPDTGTIASKQNHRITSGDGSAQLQAPEAKKAEAARECSMPRAKRLEISSMLGLPGSVGGGSTADWGPLLLAIALASGAMALLIWWRRGKRESLETVSTFVALISAVVGLALTFVPGIGIDQPPPPDAHMAVRQAHARITHVRVCAKSPRAPHQ